MDPSVLINYVHYQRLVMDNLTISAAAVFIYDYLLTLHNEIRYVWFSHWGYGKILFLLIRYMPFFDISVVLYVQVTYNIPVSHCKMAWPVASWLFVWKMIFAETILSIRTWAVWRRNKSIGIILALLTCLNAIAQCILAEKFISSMKFAPAPYPGFRGCFVTDVSRILGANYASLSVVQAVVLALMAVSAYRIYRTGNNNELALVIHRDGILSYVYLLAITLINVGIITAAPLEIMTMLSALEDTLYSVLTARIVLNIRSIGQQGYDTELHTGYHEGPSSSVPLRFLSDESFSRSHTARMLADVDCQNVLVPAEPY